EDRGRAENRVDARPPATTDARIDDRHQLVDGRQPPVAVAGKPGLRGRGVVGDRAIADPGVAAVEHTEEDRERGTVRYAAVDTGEIIAADAPRVGVVHAVDAGAGVVLLLPLKPRLVVRDRPVRVVHEPRTGRGRGAAGRRGRGARGRRVRHCRGGG